MATDYFENPAEYSRPFDSKRCGFVLGEGAGIIVLEELEHALKRNARIICELVTTSSTTDAYHLVKPDPKGQGALRAMQEAVRKAKIQPSDISIVNCHATSTPVGDSSEAAALQSFFFDQPQKGEAHFNGSAVITANKGAVGHTFGAAGCIETIFGIKSLTEQKAPPILNLNEAVRPLETLPPLNYATGKTQEIKRTGDKPLYLLKNSFGFGGVNVCLLFKEFSP